MRAFAPVQSLRLRLTRHYLLIGISAAVVLTWLFCLQFLLPVIDHVSTEQLKRETAVTANSIGREVNYLQNKLLSPHHRNELNYILPALLRAMEAQSAGQNIVARGELMILMDWLDQISDVLPAGSVLRISGETNTLHYDFSSGKSEFRAVAPASEGVQKRGMMAHDEVRPVMESTSAAGVESGIIQLREAVFSLRSDQQEPGLRFRVPAGYSNQSQHTLLLFDFMIPLGFLQPVLDAAAVDSNGAVMLVSAGQGLLMRGASKTDSPERSAIAAFKSGDWGELVRDHIRHDHPVGLPDEGGTAGPVSTRWLVNMQPLALPGLDLVVVHLTERLTLLPIFRLFKEPLLLIAGFMILLSYIVARYTARLLAKPIEQITENSQRIAAGDLSDPAEVPTSVGELRTLFREQQRMRELLREQRERLEQKAETSYRNWQEGQQDLAQRNEELQTTVDLLRTTEQELRENRLRLDLALRAAGLGVWSWVPATDMLTLDEGCARILHVQASDQMPGSFADFLALVRREDRGRVQQIIDAARHAEAGEFHLDSSLETSPDALFIVMEGRFAPGQNGADAFFSGIVRDVSAEWLHQEMLERGRISAEQASQAMGNFLAMMSHEIRTPMTGILGHLELLALDRLTSVQREHVQTIQESANALLLLINDILDFSKIRAGKMSVDLTEQRPLKIIESVVSQMSASYAEKGLPLWLDVSPEIASLVRCDPLRLRQILSNLLTNALKFTDSGEVWVRVRVLADERTRQQVFFEVRDSGIGIPEDRIDKVLEAFAQADATVTRNFGGSGLGLSICNQLAELMGGTLRLSSREGVGTSASLELWWDKVDKEPRDNWCFAGRTIAAISLPKPMLGQIAAWSAKFGMELLVLLKDELSLEEIAANLSTCNADVMVVHLDSLSGDGHASRNELARMIRELNVPTIITDLLAGEPVQISSYAVPVIRLPGSPLLPSSFLRALHGCLDGESWEGSSEDGPSSIEKIERALALEDQRPVLLVEDHPTNQRLIKQQLSVLGLRCEIHEDGAAALKAWRQGDYSLVLTDCHMPVMDGFELARQIREEERARGGVGHIAIVALTADAISGSQQKCLAAGMDDYLSKPTTIQKLGEMLLRWLPEGLSATVPEPVEQAGEETRAAGPLDLAYLQQSFQDAAIVKHMLHEYLETSERDLATLAAALERGDYDTVTEFAHRMKGAARIVGAGALASCSEQLEHASRQRSPCDFQQLLASLQAERQLVSQFIESYR